MTSELSCVDAVPPVYLPKSCNPDAVSPSPRRSEHRIPGVHEKNERAIHEIITHQHVAGCHSMFFARVDTQYHSIVRLMTYT